MTSGDNQINDRDNYKSMLEYLICTDIKDLLGEFKKSKIGLKSILLKRAKELLDSKDEKVYVKLKKLYNARYKARNGIEPEDENEKNSENLSKVQDSSEKSDSNLADKGENVHSESSESMEIEQNSQEVELSLIDIQKRLENLEATDTPACQTEKTCQIVTNPATDSSTDSASINTFNSNAIQNNQDKNNNIQSLEQNLNLNCQRPGLQVLSTVTNLNSLGEQMRVDQNIMRISSNILSMRQIFNEKFREMTCYKWCADLEEATMLIPRPKVSFKTVISLNRLKTDNVDFTKYFHVDRRLLIDFFTNKKYEIHLRIACDPFVITVPFSVKVFIDRERYFFSRIDNNISINLTAHFLRRFKTFNPIYLEFNETNICKNYFCGIYLFRRLSPYEIKNGLFSCATTSLNKLDFVKNRNVLPKGDTIRLLKEKLNPNQCEFEIVTDFIKISLICPLTKMRIKIPARGKLCQHIQCFDLESYLSLNEKSNKWSCPLCDKIIIFSNLTIDNLIKEIVQMTKCDEVKLDANGVWTEINTNSSLETSSNDTIIISEKDNSCIILD
ncbi:inhibitor of activated STAT [Brachionus plicatilis]|uniref:Inhibitor of activated STAT n=1 Tax=Brachionus plicatilis TaxID=10195 RepID=A0A3M7T5I3_BRAPC|nr:inhibitor of activated STAT [Brachionus plicatilis]